jgi:hypothetical protein
MTLDSTESAVNRWEENRWKTVFPTTQASPKQNLFLLGKFQWGKAWDGTEQKGTPKGMVENCSDRVKRKKRGKAVKEEGFYGRQ